MNYFEFHIGDHAEETAHISMMEDGAYGRMVRKYYATERALPVEIERVQRLVGARTDEERAAVETVLKEFFELREDGWHQARCDAAIAAYQAGAPEREVKKTNEAARLQRHRAERATLFKTLHDAGQFPAWNTPIAEVRALVKKLANGLATAPATACNASATAPVTEPVMGSNAPATATQYPVPNTHSPSPNTHPIYSVPKGTGADGAVPASQALPLDRIEVAGMLHVAPEGPLSEEQEKLIWNGGLAVLLASYDATLPVKAQDAKARMFVGGLAKRVKDAGADQRHLFDVIREACVERPIHPESWMSAAIASRLGKRSAPNRQEAQEQRNHAGTDAWAARMAAEIAAQSGTTQPTGA